MNERGIFIATILDQSGRAFSSATVLRMQESGGTGTRLVEEFGFQSLVDEVEGRIQCLAEALATGCSKVFVRDTCWLAGLHASREVPPTLLTELLTHLKAELLANLPDQDGLFAGDYLQAALDGSHPSSDVQPVPVDDPNPQADCLGRFLLAVLEGKPAVAEQIINEAIVSDVSISDLHHLVLTPAQRELGDMWHKGEISIAEEHLGSRIVERALVTLRTHMPIAASTDKRVLLASVPGNLHDIGLHVVADQFEMHGWTPVFLGANMPIDDLALAVRQYEPDLVALSAGLGVHLRATANSITAIRAERSDLPILVGGGPFSVIEDLWKKVGADACAPTAKLAVERGTQLIKP